MVEERCLIRHREGCIMKDETAIVLAISTIASGIALFAALGGSALINNIVSQNKR